MFDAGIRFEAVLEAGFALQVARSSDLTDPLVTYLLHEMGEETRHQRVFQRVIGQIGPTARNPLDNWVLRRVDRSATGWIIERPAMLFVLVLAGEEIPDLLQQLASEHPDTDPFLAQVNRYHRQEEARHLSFARNVLPDLWERASRAERAAVLRVAPLAIGTMFDTLIHPVSTRRSAWTGGRPGDRSERHRNASSYGTGDPQGARHPARCAGAATGVGALGVAATLRCGPRRRAPH